jgi:hypothetical protein
VAIWGKITYFRTEDSSMRKLVLAMCLAFAAAMLPVSTAFACINDSNTKWTEHEFKSNYEFKSESQEQTAPDSPTPSDSWSPIVGRMPGVALLGFAAGLVVINIRQFGIRR